jgi:cytoskeletal protein RodZ
VLENSSEKASQKSQSIIYILCVYFYLSNLVTVVSQTNSPQVDPPQENSSVKPRETKTCSVVSQTDSPQVDPPREDSEVVPKMNNITQTSPSSIKPQKTKTCYKPYTFRVSQQTMEKAYNELLNELKLNKNQFKV